MIKDVKKEVENITNWIKDFVYTNNANGVVVGNSGGKDSAVVIGLLSKSLPKDKILTVALPCESNNSDFEDAKLVAKTFDVPFIKVDLTRAYEELRDEMERVEELPTNIKKEADINIKPRLRMTAQYHLAQGLGFLVIGTGNKSEYFVGYSTKWGDAGYDFNPIANYTVTEVYELAKYLNVPDKIINKAPSDGLSGATDEDRLGVTYAQIDEYIENGKTDETAEKIILEKHQKNLHKVRPIPTYKRV